MAPVTAVVTGASGGLGSEICRILVARGIRVVLVDHDEEKSRAFMRSLSTQQAKMVVGSFQMDLTDRQQLRETCTEIVRAFPVLHYLFNNAGVLTDKPAYAKSGNDLNFEVNTLAPLQIIDLLTDSLKAAGRATIVNTSAGISLRAENLTVPELRAPGSFKKLFGPYLNSKAALNVLTAAVARELAGSGVHAFAVDPGPNRTRLTKGVGTPLWMRLFYWFLPAARKGAAKLVEVALQTAGRPPSGSFITGRIARPLPKALAEPEFQRLFLQDLRRCAADARGATPTVAGEASNRR